jgi:hypothetical protein
MPVIKLSEPPTGICGCVFPRWDFVSKRYERLSLNAGYWIVLLKIAPLSSVLPLFLGHRTGDFIEIGDTPFGSIADQ